MNKDLRSRNTLFLTLVSLGPKRRVKEAEAGEVCLQTGEEKEEVAAFGEVDVGVLGAILPHEHNRPSALSKGWGTNLISN